MANADVIQVIRESYELIVARWREVALPLAIIFMINFIVGLIRLFFDVFGSVADSASSPGFSAGMITNAMTESSAAIESLLAASLVVVLAVAAFIFIVSFIQEILWFYIYGHFYSVIKTSSAPKEGWQARMMRYAIKAVILGIVGMLAACAVAAVILIPLFLMPALSVLLFVLLVPLFLVLLVVCFLLMPFWVYYFMDNLGLIESVRRSFSLVSKNPVPFLAYIAVFFAISIAALIAAIFTCCFAFVTVPLIQIGLQLLSGVSLMKLKLALEGNGRKS
jgi:hypothetical protein